MSDTPQQPESDVKDDLAVFYGEIKAQSARLARVPRGSHTTDKLAAEIHGTVLSFQADTVGKMAQLRDGLEEWLAEVEARVEALEGDESQLTGEDADKLAALVETCKHLVTVIRGAGPQSPDVEKSLAMADALAVECGELVEEARMAGDDEDEEDEGDEVGSNGAPSLTP